MIKYHNILALYFQSKPLYLDEPTLKKPNIRKLVEQPWQQTKAEMWDEVTDTLCNLDFLQAKAAAKMTYELVTDFNEVLQVIPDNAENIREENERQARMEKYTKHLIAYSKGEIEVLEVPDSITPWNEEQINTELERIKINATKAVRLKDFLNFLGQEADNLHANSNEFRNFAIQQGWNYSESGPVVNQAMLSSSSLNDMFLLKTFTRSIWNPFPEIIKILKTSDWSRTIAITPDGERAISGSQDGLIFWDLATGKKLKTLLSHAPDGGLAITPDGKRAVSGSDFENFILWDLITGEKLNILKGHTKKIESIDITPDGGRAVSGSIDKTCILWNLSTGLALNVLRGHTEEVSSVAIAANGSRAISGSIDGTCILWDLTTGQLINMLRGHSHRVYALAITPSGERAVSCSVDSCIFWDLTTCKEIRKLNLGRNIIRQPDSLAMTPDWKWMIGSIKNTCFLWDLTRNEPVKTLIGHTEPVQAVGITSDGNKAISCSMDRTCIVWNLTASKSNIRSIGQINTITTIAITPDGKIAVSGSMDSSCTVWDLTTGEAIRTLRDHGRSVNSIDISPDGKMAISASDDKTCILWDLTTGKSIKRFIGHTKKVTSIALTSDGKRAVSGSFDSTCIVWDIVTGDAIYTLRGHTSTVLKVAITPNGNRAVSASNDNNCIIWDLTNGKPIIILKGHTSTVLAVVITPDGKRAISASLDGTCIHWNLITGQSINILKGHTDKVNTVAISPNGLRAISGSRDGSLIIWDLNTGKLINTFKGYTSSISEVAITSDGKRAISASVDHICILWNLEQPEPIAKFTFSSEAKIALHFPGGVFGGKDFLKIFIFHRIEGLSFPIINIATIRQIWDFELNRYTKPLADCPVCGCRFEPAESVLNILKKIKKKSGFKKRNSLCLTLSNELWEEPELLSTCPKCGERLKFNPFIVEVTEDYISILRKVLKIPGKTISNLIKRRFTKLYTHQKNKHGEQLRKNALELYKKGEYRLAKEELELLLKNDFEIASTCVNLTSVCILLDQQDKAIEYLTQAWGKRASAPPDAVGRMLWFLIAIDLLNGYSIEEFLGQFKTVQQTENALMEWELQPVVDHLEPKLTKKHLSLLSTLAYALSHKGIVEELNNFPEWREAKVAEIV